MNIINNQNLYSVKRNILLYGQDVVFSRKSVNSFGENTGEMSAVLSVKGLFHESNSHLKITLKEPGGIESEKKPKLLIAYSDLIAINDLVTINNKDVWMISGIEDVGNAHVLLDVSLSGDVDETFSPVDPDPVSPGGDDNGN